MPIELLQESNVTDRSLNSNFVNMLASLFRGRRNPSSRPYHEALRFSEKDLHDAGRLCSRHSAH